MAEELVNIRSDPRPPSASCSPCEDPGSWGTSPQLQGDPQHPTTPFHQHLAPHEVPWSPGQLWSVVRRVVEGQAGLATPASVQDRAGRGCAAWQVHSSCANPAPACLPPEILPDKSPPGSQGSRSQSALRHCLSYPRLALRSRGSLPSLENVDVVRGPLLPLALTPAGLVCLSSPLGGTWHWLLPGPSPTCQRDPRGLSSLFHHVRT